MKAYILKENGGIDRLQLDEAPIPTIIEAEVLIKTKAIGINRVDAFVRQNDFAVKHFTGSSLEEGPVILGWDVSGVVEKTGSEVTKFKEGDAVFGLVNFFGPGRAYAEYVAAPESHLAVKPANIGFDEAAGAGLTALTAWQALVVHGKIEAGQKVLIHGASGGVGHFAVQIAKHFGAYVIGTGSESSCAFLKALGVDEFIDYSKQKFEDYVNDADLVLDTQPGDHVIRSLLSVKPAGKLIHLLPYHDNETLSKLAKLKNVFVYRMEVQSNGEHMAEIAKLLSSGDVKVCVSHVFPFAEISSAHQEIESNRTKGKIIVEI